MATLQEICQQGKGGTIAVTITEVGAVRTVTLKAGGEKNVQDLKVSDATGTAKFSIWDPTQLYIPNSVITITETYGKDEGQFGWKLNQKRIGTVTVGGQPATTAAPLPQPTQSFTPSNEIYNVATPAPVAATAPVVPTYPSWEEVLAQDPIIHYKAIYELKMKRGDKEWAYNAVVQAQKMQLQKEDMELRKEELRIKKMDMDIRIDLLQMPPDGPSGG